MPREAEPSINERDFVLQALQENVRLDGRALDAFRDLTITFGDGFGIADVRLGTTRSVMDPRLRYNRWFELTSPRVLVRISAEVGQPFPDRKFDGIFTITTELSPIASPAFEVGR